MNDDAFKQRRPAKKQSKAFHQPLQKGTTTNSPSHFTRKQAQSAHKQEDLDETRRNLNQIEDSKINETLDGSIEDFEVGPQVLRK